MVWVEPDLVFTDHGCALSLSLFHHQSPANTSEERVSPGAHGRGKPAARVAERDARASGAAPPPLQQVAGSHAGRKGGARAEGGGRVRAGPRGGAGGRRRAPVAPPGAEGAHLLPCRASSAALCHETRRESQPSFPLPPCGRCGRATGRGGSSAGGGPAAGSPASFRPSPAPRACPRCRRSRKTWRWTRCGRATPWGCRRRARCSRRRA